MSVDAFVGLGSNMGDRPANLRRGVDLLRSNGSVIVSASSLYQTEPRDCAPQPDFLNAAIRLSWDRDARDCLLVLLDVEKAAGRVRTGRPGEPRTLDLDLLLFGSSIIQGESLTVPHPRLHLRRFVLVPLCEIAPDVRHPVLEKSLAELLDVCPDTGRVERAPGALL